MDEDLDYNFTHGSSVLSNSNAKDPDIANVTILKSLSHELNKMIEAHKSWESLDEKDKTFTAKQQIANNKWRIMILKNTKLIIDSKLKEIQ